MLTQNYISITELINEQGICIVCSKDDLSLILRCEGNVFGGTRFWTRGLGISVQK
jgi:hypothetical protein